MASSSQSPSDKGGGSDGLTAANAKNSGDNNNHNRYHRHDTAATSESASNHSPWRTVPTYQNHSDQQQQHPNGEIPGLGSVPLQPGEEEFLFHRQQPHAAERPTSAPPPGFPEDVVGERNRLAEEILFTESNQYHHLLQHSHQQQPPSSLHYHQWHPAPSGEAYGGPVGGAGAVEITASGSVSSSSSQPHAFSNLAAVLGSGLAESMMLNVGAPPAAPDASEGGDGHGAVGLGSIHPPVSISASSANNNSVGVINLSGSGDDSLSWHRQTRHAASRLLGASPPKFSISSGGSGGGGTGVAGVSASFGPGFFGGTPASTAGFPSALSAPQRPGERSTTPVELTAGTKPPKRSPPKTIGMNVVEPEPGAGNDFSGLNSFVTSSTYGGPEIRSGTTTTHVSATTTHASVASSNRTIATPSVASSSPMMGGIAESFLWSPNAPEFIPYDSQDSGGGAIAFPNNMSANRSVDSGGGASLSTELSAQQAEAEIYPFLWDIDRNKPSRTVCILRVGWLRAPDVRSACEAYGVLDSFRADFSSRGIYFCSYYDIRSAQYAAVELQSVLQRMMVLQRSSDEVVVRYCLPLNSSSQFDESQLSIADLPPHVDEPQLASMLNSYGAVRSVFPNGVGSFLVEFYSVQDAKQALLELDSSQPWGRNVAIETGVRNPVERKRGRELLATLSRWRQQMSASGGGVPSSQASNQQLNIPASEVIDPWAGRSTAVRGAGGVGLEALNPIMTAIDSTGFAVSGGGGIGDMFSRPQNATPQLVLGQDGRYQVVMPATAHPSFGGRQAPQQLPQAQQIVQGPNGQLYVIPVSGSILQQTSTPRIGNFHQQSQQQRSDPYDRRPPFGIGASMPYYTHVVAGSDGASLGSRSSYRSNTSANEDKDNRHLMLDLEEVESGIDTRTSLMVRNIPNKYTQQMLLSEFEENGHGPGVIDFFYLPIDFKNRCNRGYAFINFVDYKDILTFHRRYFGKHWRTFNSDKICDITYARIQGKAAMLKRFENSALMEKDDEYKPLVFVSDGPNKGQRLPFPGPSSSAAVPHLHHQLLPQQQQQQQQHPAS